MERLTREETITNDDWEERYFIKVKDDDYEAAIELLAEYENTGFTPKEIKEFNREIEELKKENKLLLNATWTATNWEIDRKTYIKQLLDKVVKLQKENERLQKEVNRSEKEILSKIYKESARALRVYEELKEANNGR